MIDRKRVDAPWTWTWFYLYASQNFFCSIPVQHFWQFCFYCLKTWKPQIFIHKCRSQNLWKWKLDFAYTAKFCHSSIITAAKLALHARIWSQIASYRQIEWIQDNILKCCEINSDVFVAKIALTGKRYLNAPWNQRRLQHFWGTDYIECGFFCICNILAFNPTHVPL